MILLARVTEKTREQIYRELDDLGPRACYEEMHRDLRRHNPHLLEIALKWAGDVGTDTDVEYALLGFCVLYRALIVQTSGTPIPALQTDMARQLHPLPRVMPETRDAIVGMIDSMGCEVFFSESLELLDKSNGELLQIAHDFASKYGSYLVSMQGFALLFRSLLIQALIDRAHLQ